MFLDYTVGLGNIFTEKEIQIAKRSLSFDREYQLRFSGLEGNVFLNYKIDKSIQLGREMDIYNQILAKPELTPMSQFYIGVDSGFGSSAFAIVLVTILDDKICVLESLELYRQQFNDCIDKISEVMLKYHLDINNTKILVDASAPSVVSAIKSQMNEPTDYLTLLNNRKKYKLRDIYFDMTVIPVTFNTATKKEMLINLKELLDAEMIVMNPECHSNLILALRTAQATDMILHKDLTSANDVLDAFGLCCRRISLNRSENQRFDFKAPLR
jgi:hypothetical protein